MSRILFAAARGARIQQEMYNWTKTNGKEWRDIITICLPTDYYSYRVHPDDTHLQYGAISTALISFALKAVASVRSEAEGFAASVFWTSARGGSFQSIEHRSYFMLFLAEEYADEGC